MIPTTPEILAALPWIVFALFVPIILRRRAGVERFPPPTAPPLVSIIVPARNEAENITTCLQTLLATCYQNWEIIVVDDASVDGTADIVRAIAAQNDRVRLVEGDRLPEGWLGKSWACWQGYKAASGEILLFTDADTRHGDQLLGHAVGALDQRNADLVSVLPRQLMEGFWERVVLPHVFVTILLRFHDADKISRSINPRDAIANGQFMLFKRESYERIGGHESVRGTVVEDLRLAQRIKEEQLSLLLLHAEDHMATRMYRNLRGIVEGWSKNVAQGAQQTVVPWLAPLMPWLLATGILLFWFVPPAIFAYDLFRVLPRGFAGWSFTATVASLLFWWMTHLRFRIPLLHALLYPVGALVTSLIFFRSAVRGRKVEWRGREYRGIAE